MPRPKHDHSPRQYVSIASTQTLLLSQSRVRQLLVHEPRDCPNRAKARKRCRMNARRKKLFGRVVKQSHQPLPACFRQHCVVRKLSLAQIATCKVIDRSFRDLDLKVLLDPKQKIEQVHRSKTEIVEEELLRLDWFTLRECERLAHEGEYFHGCVARTHPVTPPSTHHTWPVTY